MNDKMLLAFFRNLAVVILAACSLVLVVGAFSDSAWAGVVGVSGSAPPSSASVDPSVGSRPVASALGTVASELSQLSQWAADHLPASLQIKVLGVALWKLATLVIVLGLGLLLRQLLQSIIRSRLGPMAARAGSDSVKHVVDVFAGPASLLIVALSLAIVYPELQLSDRVNEVLSISVRILALISICLSVYRLSDVVADRMADKAERTESKFDDQLVPLVRKTLKVTIACAGFLLILQNLHVNVASLVAGLGIGGVAVALAAKDTIANFFGSLMIFVDRPFQIGDWIVIGNVEGIVEEVGFRSTRVRTFYDSRVLVPNAHFTDAAIDNMGRRQYRRYKTTLNLTYDTTPDQLEAFVEGIRAIIVANPYSRKDYYEIHFAGFGAHSLDVMVYFFFEVDSWTAELEQKHNVLMEILRLAQALGVEFAFPTQKLHVEALTQAGTIGQVPPPHPNPKMAEVIEAFGPGGSLSRPEPPLLTQGYHARTIHRAGNDDGG